ncbi:DUF6069 family protein [Cryptosporangium phraense]|uniref:Uncharacterized protein n=1 Tax=Cryptosporangium phraense TaxID=2593070 RepID=A0A545AUV7_9ACTN|nr:DUF6069 family protein [Cryptosporangium phraense]TQS45104.1 hypothetical protein FL583_11440 [Cryptosporangium phraense]
MATESTNRPVIPRTSAVRAVGGVILAVVASVVVNAIIAAAAHAAGADDEFMPLNAGSFTFFTVVGVLAAAFAWTLIRRLSRRPSTVLRWLVPGVVVFSLIPDILLLVDGSLAGTSTLAVLALMLMHLAVAAIAVPIFLRVLPVTSSPAA